MLEANQTVVSRWISNYVKFGINALLNGKFGGHHRNLTLDEET